MQLQKSVILTIFLTVFIFETKARPSPQFSFPQLGGGQTANTFAIAGLAGAGLFATKNTFEGNNNVAIRPQLGLNYNPQTQEFAPVGNLAFQVGEGQAAPTFNLGAQYDSQGFAPVVGAGVALGEDNGGINPNLNTGYVIRDGQANPVFGAAANVGSIDAGRLPFGRRRRSILAY